MLESYVPASFIGSKEWTCEGSNCVKYEAYRGKLEAYMKDDVLYAGTKVKYWVDYCRSVGGYCPRLASCGLDGSEKPELIVGLKSNLTWSEDWQVVSRTTLMPVTSSKPCKVTFANINISDHVAGFVQPEIEKNIQGIDNTIAQYANVKAKAEEMWKQFHSPIKVYDKVWLQISPEQIFVAPLTGKGSTLKTSIGVKAYPKVIVGDTLTMNSPVKPLPKLKIVTGENPGGFKMEIDVQTSFEDATKLTKQFLVGQKFESGSKNITILDANIYGAGEHMVAQLNCTGSFKGLIYAIGKPYYDETDRSIKIKDFDFSLESKNVLIKSANWLLHGTIRNKMAAYMSYPIGSQIDEAKKAINEALQKPIASTFRLDGGISKLEPIGVYNTGKGLRTIIMAMGTLKGKLE